MPSADYDFLVPIIIIGKLSLIVAAWLLIRNNVFIKASRNDEFKTYKNGCSEMHSSCFNPHQKKIKKL